MSAPPTEVSHSMLRNKILPNPLEKNSSLSKVNVHYPCFLHSVRDYFGGCESISIQQAVRHELTGHDLYAFHLYSDGLYIMNMHLHYHSQIINVINK